MSVETEDNIVDIFTRHAVSTSIARSVPQVTGATIPYHAYISNRTLKRPPLNLKFYLIGNKRRGVPYSHYAESLATSDDDLALIFAQSVFILKGYRLGKIEEDFDQGYLISVTCFDPTRHIIPEEEDACIVTSIIHQAVKEFESQ